MTVFTTLRGDSIALDRVVFISAPNETIPKFRFDRLDGTPIYYTVVIQMLELPDPLEVIITSYLSNHDAVPASAATQQANMRAEAYAEHARLIELWKNTELKVSVEEERLIQV